MAESQPTVFLSYRRQVSSFIARAVFQHLRHNQYDVFMDVESIDSGQFEKIILAQIAARAHFLVILTPGTLERCQEPGDWLKREIEYAMDLGRNIIPILVNEFRFDENARTYLTGKLHALPRYNGLTLPHEYFDAAMERLCMRFLNQPAQGVITPAPRQDTPIIQATIAEVASHPPPTEQELSAEEYFNRGLARGAQGDHAGAIADYNQAIALKPAYAAAYNNRGNARRAQGDHAGAIADYSHAITDYDHAITL